MSAVLQCLIIAILIACATAIPGVLLVLRGIALMSDALSHALVFSIAVLFLMTHSINSKYMFIGAIITGLMVAYAIEALIATRRLYKDAAIAVVFPLFFSLGVILISRYARNAHLDLDMVILGELIFTPFQRLEIAGVDIGAYALWSSLGLLIFNTLLCSLLYRHLLVTTFDSTFSRTIGWMPLPMYTIIMTMASMTCVAAFDCVGAIVVVALMIVPACAAYFMADSMKMMLVYAVVFAIFASIFGFWFAWYLNVSIAGSIALWCGIFFLITYISAPGKGLLAYKIYNKNKKKALYDAILHHYGAQKKSITIEGLEHDLGWSYKQAHYYYERFKH